MNEFISQAFVDELAKLGMTARGQVSHVQGGSYVPKSQRDKAGRDFQRVSGNMAETSGSNLQSRTIFKAPNAPAKPKVVKPVVKKKPLPLAHPIKSGGVAARIMAGK
jgi:hypothetical protein